MTKVAAAAAECNVVDLTPSPPPAQWWSFFDCFCPPDDMSRLGYDSRHSAFMYERRDVDVDLTFSSSSPPPPRHPPKKATIAPPVHHEGNGERGEGRPGVGVTFACAETQLDVSEKRGNAPRSKSGRHHAAHSVNSASQEFIESLGEELRLCKKRNASKCQDIERLQRELGEVKRLLAATVREKNEALAEKEVLEMQREGLAEKSESLQQEMERLRKSVADTTAANNSAEVESLQKDLDSTASKKKKTNGASELEASLLQTVADSEVKVANLQVELESAKEQLEEANEKSDAEEVCRIQKELGSKIDSLEADVRESKKDTSAANDLETGRMMALSSITLDGLLAQQKASMSSDTEGLQWSMDVVPPNEAIAERDRLAAEIERMQKEMSNVASERDELLAERDSMQQKIGCLMSEVTELTSTKLSGQLNAAQQENRIQEMAKQIGHLSTEIEQANERCASLEAKLNGAKENARRVQEELSSKMIALEMALFESKEDAATKSVKIARLQMELDTVRKTNGAAPKPTRQNGNQRVTVSPSKSPPANRTDNLAALFSTPPSSPVRNIPTLSPPRSATNGLSTHRPVVPGSDSPVATSPLTVGSEVTVQGFSHESGLSVEFKCTKPNASNRQDSVIVAHYTNTSDAPIYGLRLRVAVPKYVVMKLKQPTSTTIPVTKEDGAPKVTQTIYVTNTMLGQKNLVLKLKVVGFTSRGRKLEHTATCSGFPMGQF